MQDQDTRSRSVVQPRPGQFDFLQLAQGLAAEEFNRFLVAGFRRVRAELAVELPPSELLRSAEREGAVGEPQVQIKAQRTSLERRESVHVNRYGVVDDLVKELLPR